MRDYTNMSSRSSILIIILLLLYNTSVYAADAYGAYGFFPQSSSRVLSMGGAFTALSDDASAIIYNPAGLVQARWSIDISGDQNKIVNKDWR